MIQGTRVGVHTLPDPTSERRCPRCGVTFRPADERVILTAPCMGCRPILRAEGDTTIWSVRTLKRLGML